MKLALIDRLKWKMEKIVESHPYSYFIVKKAFHVSPFLLPHDKTFFGLRHLIHEGKGLFLDVGANDGVSALSFRKINKTYRIVSIEPNIYHANSLRRVKRKITDFDFMIAAAGDRESVMILYTPHYLGVPLHSAASLLLDQLRLSIESNFPGYIVKRIKYSSQEVKVITLDSLHLHPSIIKVDAEGYDMHVLRGLKCTIEYHRPYIMVENSQCTFNELSEFCNELSYVVLSYDYQTNKFRLDMKETVRNVFCIPGEKTERLWESGLVLT